MESFPLFFRIRAITFTCIMLFSFLWLVLLCVESFARWGASDPISRSLMALFMLINTITLIMLPILILVEFRIWLDAARLLLLFVLQTGSAAAGSFWSPKIHCPNQTPDDVGVCQLIAVYTMIACWIIPAILFFYSTYFAVVVYLQSRIPVVIQSKRSSGVDAEQGSTDSISLWREKLRETVGVQGTGTNRSPPPRPLALHSMAHARSSLVPPWSKPLHQSILPNGSHRQSTMPFLSHSSQQSPTSLSSVAARHQSLPAFKYGHAPFLAMSVAPPLPNTPSSHTCSIASPTSSRQSFISGPGIPDVKLPIDYRVCSRHPLMVPLCSSPREMQSGEGGPTPRSTRARLSKPPPAHLAM